MFKFLFCLFYGFCMGTMISHYSIPIFIGLPITVFGVALWIAMMVEDKSQ